MRDFGDPLSGQILERCSGCEGKAQDYNTCIRVHKRAEAVVTFFTSCIPELDSVGLLIMTKVEHYS